MNALTIIIVAHNQCEQAKLTIESIRNFADVENLQVVLVDNASTDGLKDWASQQQDFAFIYMDEGKANYGDLLNQVIEALQIDTDILVMEAHYMITPFALSRMQEALYSGCEIAVVGGVSNNLIQHQALGKQYDDYEKCAEYSVVCADYNIDVVMGLDAGAFLIKKSVFDEIGGFETKLKESGALIKDLSLKMLKIEKRMAVCTGAVLWDLLDDKEFRDYVVLKRECAADAKTMEDIWGMHYFNFQYNPNLVNLICDLDKNTNTVRNNDADANAINNCDSGEKNTSKTNILEIGCDLGATLFEIKSRIPEANIYGCELNENAVAVANCFMNAKVCNIESEQIPFDGVKYDYIIFGDVLEHLRDPEQALRYTMTLLKENGKILASIPNVMHISVIEQLLKGNFTYQETGLLDKTHIHMFTYNEIVQMFKKLGLEIKVMKSINFGVSDRQKELISKLLLIESDAKEFMYETFQYVLAAEVAK